MLVIGATGRVGRMLCHHWQHDVTAPALTMTSRSPSTVPDMLCWSPLDGPHGLLNHLAQRGADQVPAAMLVLAGVTPGAGVPDEALAGNRALAEASLHAASAAGIRRVLVASSSAVYGVDPHGAAFAETTQARPFSAYGKAKLEMETACQPARERGLEVCALRIGNVAGADALLGPLTGQSAVGAEPLAIDAFADGMGPLRSYIGVATMARVIAALVRYPAPLPKVLNLAAPNPVRMVALAKAAGWPVRRVTAPETACQSITLDCSLLNGLCPMSSTDSLPETMVQQWKATWP